MKTIGFFGKIPSHGDFVSRSLPSTFIAPWDRWLQAGLAKSKEALGAEWLDIYLTSPVWRFALAPGLLGKAAAAGLFIPSVDRVGRYFPFTMACLLDHAPQPMNLRAKAADWFARLETAALGVLHDDFVFDDLLSDLEDLTMPIVPADEAAKSGPWRVNEDDSASLIDHLSRHLPSPYGLFWTSGSSAVAASSLLIREMPTAGQFTALLDGAWADHGWGDEAS